jgi:hypothetical protein
VADGQPVAVIVGYAAGGGPTGTDLAAADDQGDFDFLAPEFAQRGGYPVPLRTARPVVQSAFIPGRFDCKDGIQHGSCDTPF